MAHVHPDELQASAVHTQNEVEPEFDNEQIISERTLSKEESQEFIKNEKIGYEGVDFTLLKNTESELENAHADYSSNTDFTGDSELEQWETLNRSTESLAQEARMKGYEGEACHTCQQFTMVRNGSCLKCASCGATSGCS